MAASAPWEWTPDDFRWLLERMYGLFEDGRPTTEQLLKTGGIIVTSNKQRVTTHTSVARHGS